MMTLVSTGAVLRALRGAREIALDAYMLHPGAVEDALVAAAARGAHVRVRLEGRPYDADGRGGVLRCNAEVIARLQRAGADAELDDTDAAHPQPLHTKELRIGAARYLDDCNWTGGAGETIVRVPAGARDAVSASKRPALADEAGVLSANGQDVAVESESFGCCNAVFGALDRLARAGRAPRVLVAARDCAHNERERAALQRLVQDGARVRMCDANEKFALAGTRAWLGSANATAAFSQPDQRDWGASTAAPRIVAHLREVFERRWSRARPFAGTLG